MTLVCAQCLQILNFDGEPSGKYPHKDNKAIKPHTCNECLKKILEREGMDSQGIASTINEIKDNARKGIVRRVR